MVIFRHTFIIGQILLMLFFSGALAEGGEQKPLARVGERILNQSDFDREIYGRLEFAKIAKLKTKSFDPSFISLTLDRLIERELLLRYGKDHALIDEKKVQNGLSEVIAKMGGTSIAESKIASEGLKWESWKANFSDDLRLLMIADSLANKVRNPKKEELDDFMNNPVNQVYDPERVKVRTIVINNRNPLWEDAKLAEFVRELKANPKTFSEKAEKVSDGKSSKLAGSQGFILKGTFDEKLEDVIFRLKVGEVSDVVSFGSEKYLFLVEDHKGGKAEGKGKVALATEAWKVAKASQDLRLLIYDLKEKTKIEKYFP